MLKPLTKTEQLENTLLAMMLWHKVPPDKVDLTQFVCGSTACFGGWLATWAEFKAKGVVQIVADQMRGAPAIYGVTNSAAANSKIKNFAREMCNKL